MTVIAALIAAIGGIIAGVGGLWSGREANDTLVLESTPALVISCKVATPNELTENYPVLFIDGAWAQYSDFPPGAMANQPDPNHHFMRLPHSVDRCSIANYGRMPVLLVRVTFHFEQGAEPIETSFTIGGIVPDAPFEFDIADIGSGFECIWPDSRVVAQTPVNRSFQGFVMSRAGNSRIVEGVLRMKSSTVTVKFPPDCDYSKPMPN